MDRLATERLVLRPATADDAAFVLELLNDPGFIDNIADRGVRTLEQAREYIQGASIYDYTAGLGFNVVEPRPGGAPIGTCGLVKRETLAHPDVGYALLDRAAGQGYAVEAAGATLEHAWRTLRLPRVLAVTSPSNARSRRVLEKLGMVLDGMVDLPGYDGKSCLYATDWR